MRHSSATAPDKGHTIAFELLRCCGACVELSSGKPLSELLKSLCYMTQHTAIL